LKTESKENPSNPLLVPAGPLTPSNTILPIVKLLPNSPELVFIAVINSLSFGSYIFVGCFE